MVMPAERTLPLEVTGACGHVIAAHERGEKRVRVCNDADWKTCLSIVWVESIYELTTAAPHSSRVFLMHNFPNRTSIDNPLTPVAPDFVSLRQTMTPPR